VFTKIRFFFKGKKMGAENITLINLNKDTAIVQNNDGDAFNFVKHKEGWILSGHTNSNCLLYGTTLE
jgi:hypothetical protein